MSEEKIKIDDALIELQRLIVPEIYTMIESRYNILSAIKSEEPIGRRNLAFLLDMSERQIRNEVDFLQGQKLVCVERQGIVLTASGRMIIDTLKSMLYAYNNLEDIENQLKEKLKLKHAFVSPGDMDINYQVVRFMGKSGAQYIQSILGQEDTIALTGGASTESIAKEMKESHHPDVQVIPARGGIGKSHATQANNIVAEMGLKLHANYDLLHLPDNIDNRLLSALMDYPEIKRVFNKMEKIDIFVFGIGRADVLADWRNMKTADKKKLLDRGAVGEAFGYYFDIQGNIIEPSSSIGVDIDRYMEIPNAIAVSGGRNKAEAIIGVCRVKPGTVLITDESAARAILEIS